ncbi:ion-translocating ATPase [Babesia caballi]|uniref:Ion-translocating ATPase n=1 Tax=Babesia caballi TaxID=5871 RepID=A0AAV4LY90_BABCB|nr:ion-translocating ATPase [Babesia caballi]
MAKLTHRRSVHRYVGRDAPFARFSATVFAIASATGAYHWKTIYDAVTGAWADEDVDIDVDIDAEDASKVARVDFAAIGARLRALTRYDAFLIVLLVVCVLCAATMLFSFWYPRVRVVFFFQACPFVEGSDEFAEYVRRKGTHVYITAAPATAEGVDERRTVAAELIPLQRSKLYTYYTHGHRKYILNEGEGVFQLVEHIDAVELRTLEAWRGLSSKEDSRLAYAGLERSLAVCEDSYGDNDYAIPACNFWAMLLDAFLSPFFLFQLLASLIWVLDNYWYYSMLSVFSMVAIEVQMVNKRIRDYDRINSMRIPPADVSVYRDGRWATVSSLKLYPGDLFLLAHDAAAEATVAPVDCLILTGEVVVDESILTGESVPQFKSAIDCRTIRAQRGVITSSESEMRQSTVFAGTSVMLCRADGPGLAGVKSSKQGCVCMVLRTGFESYQGRLVNAIIRSGDRVTASTTEGWCFLGILLTFALASCFFVFKRLPTANLKKLVLTMLHIITAVIPPEFPVILSMAVTIAIMQLHKKGMYCTEPFRVPYAGELRVCAFDKTGTLTEDQMKVVGIVAGGSGSDPDGADRHKAPIAAALVVGGCHSLSRVAGNVVGDPMEKAAFDYVGWSLSADNKVIEPQQPWFFAHGHAPASLKITVLRRWQFVSELGRMSTIVTVGGGATYWQKPADAAATELPQFSLPQPHPYLSFGHSFDGELVLLCKGAPERLRNLLRQVPEHYDWLYQKLALSGMRVLALACRKLSIPPSMVASVDRAEVESSLDFVGFLALESPIRPSSVLCMRHLEGHKLVMITGDNVLTACHVANAVEIGDRTAMVPSPSLRRAWGDFAILVWSRSRFFWSLRNGDPLPTHTSSGDFLEEMRLLARSMRLCVTGPAMDALVDYERDTGRRVLGEVVLNATVFARVSPQQKEFVIRTFKRAGMKTAMCGDGTNDMAALKAAHVGISLLKSSFKKKHSKVAEKLEGMIRKETNLRNREALEQLQRDMQEGLPEIKLGEASIASPFTYRKNDVLCVPLLVRSGRCALTNVVLLYKIMGLNSLITSVGMSVLAVDGVNFSDVQTTIYSLSYTFMLMALSRSKPAQVYSSRRPEESIFRPANFTSFVSQCCLHVAVLLHLWHLGKSARAPDYVPNLDAPFEPSLVNTLVFYGCFTVNIACFLANYPGYPYMQPLGENKFVYKPISVAVLFVLVLVCDFFLPLSEYMSLVSVPFPAMRLQVLAVLALDVLGAKRGSDGASRQYAVQELLVHAVREVLGVALQRHPSRLRRRLRLGVVRVGLAAVLALLQILAQRLLALPLRLAAPHLRHDVLGHLVPKQRLGALLLGSQYHQRELRLVLLVVGAQQAVLLDAPRVCDGESSRPRVGPLSVRLGGTLGAVGGGGVATAYGPPELRRSPHDRVCDAVDVAGRGRVQAEQLAGNVHVDLAPEGQGGLRQREQRAALAAGQRRPAGVGDGRPRLGLQAPLLLQRHQLGHHAGRVGVGRQRLQVHRVHLARQQARRRGRAELREPLHDRRVRYAHDRGHRLRVQRDAVHARRHHQRRAAQPRRPPARAQPVAPHRLDQPHARGDDLVHLLLQLQLVGEALEEDGGVHVGDLQVQHPHQLHEDLPDDLDGHLQHVGEVDEQVGRLEAPAGRVEAAAGHVLVVAAHGEVALHRQRVDARRLGHQLARDVQVARRALDVLLAALHQLVQRLRRAVLERAHAAAPGGHEAADERRVARRVLRILDRLEHVVLLQHRATVAADQLALLLAGLNLVRAAVRRQQLHRRHHRAEAQQRLDVDLALADHVRHAGLAAHQALVEGAHGVDELLDVVGAAVARVGPEALVGRRGRALRLGVAQVQGVEGALGPQLLVEHQQDLRGEGLGEAERPRVEGRRSFRVRPQQAQRLGHAAAVRPAEGAAEALQHAREQLPATVDDRDRLAAGAPLHDHLVRDGLALALQRLGAPRSERGGHQRHQLQPRLDARVHAQVVQVQNARLRPRVGRRGVVGEQVALHPVQRLPLRVDALRYRGHHLGHHPPQRQLRRHQRELQKLRQVRHGDPVERLHQRLRDGALLLRRQLDLVRRRRGEDLAAQLQRRLPQQKVVAPALAHQLGVHAGRDGKHGLHQPPQALLGGDRLVEPLQRNPLLLARAQHRLPPLVLRAEGRPPHPRERAQHGADRHHQVGEQVLQRVPHPAPLDEPALAAVRLRVRHHGAADDGERHGEDAAQAAAAPIQRFLVGRRARPGAACGAGAVQELEQHLGALLELGGGHLDRQLVDLLHVGCDDLVRQPPLRLEVMQTRRQRHQRLQQQVPRGLVLRQRQAVPDALHDRLDVGGDQIGAALAERYERHQGGPLDPGHLPGARALHEQQPDDVLQNALHRLRVVQHQNRRAREHAQPTHLQLRAVDARQLQPEHVQQVRQPRADPRVHHVARRLGLRRAQHAAGRLRLHPLRRLGAVDARRHVDGRAPQPRERSLEHEARAVEEHQLLARPLQPLLRYPLHGADALGVQAGRVHHHALRAREDVRQRLDTQVHVVVAHRGEHGYAVQNGRAQRGEARVEVLELAHAELVVDGDVGEQQLRPALRAHQERPDRVGDELVDGGGGAEVGGVLLQRGVAHLQTAHEEHQQHAPVVQPAQRGVGHEDAGAVLPGQERLPERRDAAQQRVERRHRAGCNLYRRVHHQPAEHVLRQYLERVRVHAREHVHAVALKEHLDRLRQLQLVARRVQRAVQRHRVADGHQVPHEAPHLALVERLVRKVEVGVRGHVLQLLVHHVGADVVQRLYHVRAVRRRDVGPQKVVHVKLHEDEPVHDPRQVPEDGHDHVQHLRLPVEHSQHDHAVDQQEYLADVVLEEPQNLRPLLVQHLVVHAVPDVRRDLRQHPAEDAQLGQRLLAVVRLRAERREPRVYRLQAQRDERRPLRRPVPDCYRGRVLGHLRHRQRVVLRRHRRLAPPAREQALQVLSAPRAQLLRQVVPVVLGELDQQREAVEAQQVHALDVVLPRRSRALLGHEGQHRLVAAVVRQLRQRRQRVVRHGELPLQLQRQCCVRRVVAALHQLLQSLRRHEAAFVGREDGLHYLPA